MGLDSVELVMGFEEAFGLAIPDRDAAQLITPRHVLEYVAARLPMAPTDGCATQRTFYALRRGLRAAGVAQVELRPATPLPMLANRWGWTVLWTRVRTTAGEPGWPEQVPWPRRGNTGPRTLAGLARYVARHPPPAGQPWTRERIEFTIPHVVVEVVGIDEFSLDDEFVRDMKID